MSQHEDELNTTSKTRILVVEDHPVFIFGLRELINQESDLMICGEAADVTSAWEKIQNLKPDMVIVDISLKGRDGIELIRDINKRYKTLPTLVLSMHEESLYGERALAAGARGYIMKQEASDSIVKAIRCVLDGEIYASQQLTRTLLTRFVSHPDPTISPMDKLTDRELEVFRAIGRGFDTRQIAEKLHLSVKTIGTYRERIKEKLGIKNAAELIRCAVRWIDQQDQGTGSLNSPEEEQ